MGGGVLLAPRTSRRRQHLSLARRSVTAASMGGGGIRGDFGRYFYELLFANLFVRELLFALFRP